MMMRFTEIHEDEIHKFMMMRFTSMMRFTAKESQRKS
jgi:hypothetical protein